MFVSVSILVQDGLQQVKSKEQSGEHRHSCQRRNFSCEWGADEMAHRMAVGMGHNSIAPALPPTLLQRLLNDFWVFLSDGVKSV